MKRETNNYKGESKKKCSRCKKLKKNGEFYPSYKGRTVLQCISCQLEVRETQDQRPPQKVPDKNYWGDNEIYQ